MNSAPITVIIATIPPRTKMLRQAIWSVLAQTLRPEAIIVEYDHEHEGAAATKNRALEKVTTRWTACLDDDDWLKPNHLQVLYDAAFLDEPYPDVIYSWPEMVGNTDPRPDRFGVPFDADELRRGSYIPTTALFKTRLAQAVGGFQPPPPPLPPLDDHGLWLAMLNSGAEFDHVPERTWLWRVEGQNTSGLGNRWVG